VHGNVPKDEAAHRMRLRWLLVLWRTAIGKST
jgi:hypothetical protein